MSKNLIKRIITSIILLCLLFFINFSHQLIFISSILLIGFLICYEGKNIFSKLISLHSKKKKTHNLNFKFLILNMICFFYVFFIFCNFTIKIYTIEGSLYFLYLISICIFTDIGGYAFGKFIGGKKLTKISPNKTIAVAIGSFFFSLIPLILYSNLNYINLEFDLRHIFFALTISLISQLGDLFISFFKRKVKIKDTGNILPGHGGILDRLDGIVFALPFSYFLLGFFK